MGGVKFQTATNFFVPWQRSFGKTSPGDVQAPWHRWSLGYSALCGFSGGILGSGIDLPWILSQIPAALDRDGETHKAPPWPHCKTWEESKSWIMNPAQQTPSSAPPKSGSNPKFNPFIPAAGWELPVLSEEKSSKPSLVEWRVGPCEMWSLKFHNYPQVIIAWDRNFFFVYFYSHLCTSGGESSLFFCFMNNAGIR